MGSTAEKLNKLLETKADIKAAIVEQGQSVSETDTFSSYGDKIRAISNLSTGTSDATAQAEDILSGETAYAKGVKVTGTMVNQGAKTATLNAGGSYTIPSGYHNGSGKVTANSLASQTNGDAAATDIVNGKTAWVNGVKVTGSLSEVVQGTPSISVSSSGLITASATQDAGIVAAGTKSATKQLTTQAAKTVMPSTYNQTAVSSGRYTTGAVTVQGDANLIPANIKSGVSIFGVTGTASSGGATVETFTEYDVNMTEAEYKKNNINYWGTEFTIDVPGLTSSSQLVGFGFYIKYDKTSYGFFVFGPSPYSDWPVLGADMNGNASELFSVTLGTNRLTLRGDGAGIYGMLVDEGMEDPSDWNDGGGWVAFNP